MTHNTYIYWKLERALPISGLLVFSSKHHATRLNQDSVVDISCVYLKFGLTHFTKTEIIIDEAVMELPAP